LGSPSTPSLITLFGTHLFPGSRLAAAFSSSWVSSFSLRPEDRHSHARAQRGVSDVGAKCDRAVWALWARYVSTHRHVNARGIQAICWRSWCPTRFFIGTFLLPVSSVVQQDIARQLLLQCTGTVGFAEPLIWSRDVCGLLSIGYVVPRGSDSGLGLWAALVATETACYDASHCQARPARHNTERAKWTAVLRRCSEQMRSLRDAHDDPMFDFMANPVSDVASPLRCMLFVVTVNNIRRTFCFQIGENSKDWKSGTVPLRSTFAHS